MTKNRRIAVIGAGIAGLGPAWQLARRGWDVEVFEAGTLGAGATSKAGGMLAPTAEATYEEEELLALELESLHAYPRWIDELQSAADVDVDYRTEGTLIVAIDRDDAEALDRLHDYHQRLGLTAERLDRSQALELEPGLSPRIHRALRVTSDVQVDPAAMLNALAVAVTRQGGTIHEECPVEALDIDDALRGLILKDGRRLPFDHVLLATGAWTPQIGGIPEGVLPHVRPVRGQMLCLGLGDPPLLRHVLRAPDAYLIPKSDGRLLVGATMEERGFDPHPTAGGFMDLLVGAWEALPGVYDAPVLDTWVGFRPITLSNHPTLGPTDIEGLYLSVGHGRNGILLAPTTAYELASWIDSGEPPEILRSFAPRSPSSPPPPAR